MEYKKYFELKDQLNKTTDLAEVNRIKSQMHIIKLKINLY